MLRYSLVRRRQCLKLEERSPAQHFLRCNTPAFEGDRALTVIHSINLIPVLRLSGTFQLKITVETRGI